MPPSSQRKTRARKQPDPQDRSDMDDADVVATPTRKRRRVTNHDATKSPTTDPVYDTRLDSSARRRKTRSSEVKIYEEDASFNEDDSETVIRNLRKAKYDIRAKIDYANEVQEVAHPDGKQAYAKIAGNGWTFYVDDLEVRIGRPPDERLPMQDPSAGEAHVNGIEDKSHVHIDLGPSKIISRLHAEIRYNANENKWHLAVNGRNGLKLDEQPLQRGQTSVLHCGSVIDVAGTQMMFVTPNDEPVIHPAISSQVRKQEDDDDDDDDEGMDQGQRPSHPQRTPIRGPAPRSGGGRHPSSSQIQSSSQQHGHRGYANSAAPASLMQNDGTSDGPSRSGQLGPKTSPIYSRGVMIESSEDIDYSLETAKDLKPPHSYAQLIGMAILDSPEEKLTLAKIYDWIKLHYAFYRFSGGGWQNSIRHNLSLNKCFEKIARRTDEPGKGMKWQIVAEHRDEFIKKGLSNVRRTGGRGSSGPESPAKETTSRMATERRGDDPFYTSSNQDVNRRSSQYGRNSPGSTPPKLGGYNQPGPTSTPERSGLPQLHGAEGSSPRFTTGTSPYPFNRNRFNGLNETAAAGSPGGPTMLLGSDPNDHFATPLVTRHAPRLAPPSTAHLPSQFMPMSSPAPFWKYADFGSTPARPNVDLSPVKTIKKEVPTTPTDGSSGQPNEGAHNKATEVQSSSPPVPSHEVGQESPTRQLSSRSGDRLTGPVDNQGNPPINIPANTAVKMPVHDPESGPTDRPQAGNEEEEEEEEEGMIDLARGFQPIGSFHRNMSASVIRGN